MTLAPPRPSIKSLYLYSIRIIKIQVFLKYNNLHNQIYCMLVDHQLTIQRYAIDVFLKTFVHVPICIFTQILSQSFLHYIV